MGSDKLLVLLIVRPINEHAAPRGIVPGPGLRLTVAECVSDLMKASGPYKYAHLPLLIPVGLREIYNFPQPMLLLVQPPTAREGANPLIAGWKGSFTMEVLQNENTPLEEWNTP